MTPKLKEKYNSEVVPALKEQFGIGNVNRVPRLQKIVVNMGMGVAEKDAIKKCCEDLAAITGQKPVITKSRKSISNFKIRAGMPLGAKVTLRHAKMYEFLDRLIAATLPRIRDFRGVPTKSFDGRGNYTLGLKEQSIFPEMDPDKIAQPQGMDITIITSTSDDDEARALLKLMGIPFAAN